MSCDSRAPARLDLRGVTTLLCDADGTLFPSEVPAYVASARVTRAFADRYGLTGDFSAENLRRTGLGRNFRSLTADLLAAAGVKADPDELAEWIERERREVTGHLAATLGPVDEVRLAAAALLRDYRLAVVTSSASARVLACLAASGLETSFAAQHVFSAEDSMAQPVGKPDPAIYRHAVAQLHTTAAACLAIEDSRVGVRSAVSAGIPTVGIVQFVPADERLARADELRAAGALHVTGSWAELSTLLSTRTAGL